MTAERAEPTAAGCVVGDEAPALLGVEVGGAAGVEQPDEVGPVGRRARRGR